MTASAALTLRVDIETWPLKAPFRIAGRVTTEMPLVVATLDDGALSGRGEAAGVFFDGESATTIAAELERIRPALSAGIDRAGLRTLLPAGGARNALDCALWELEARRAGLAVWQLAGLAAPKPIVTHYTIGADAPEIMAYQAGALDRVRAIKLKLVGDDYDVARVRAVRAARPDVRLSVDGNQGFDRAGLAGLLPALEDARVDLVEQPLPVGQEAVLAHVPRTIPFAADESARTADDLERLRPYFDVVNIKLDKTGGLTAAFEMAHRARALGFGVMVGNMIGTSLAMAPAFLVGQLCDYADLDGPTLLEDDREPGATYCDGTIWCPAGLWR